MDINNSKFKPIFVLAGGNKNDNEPHEFVKKRLDRAVELYQLNSKKLIKSKIICMGGGTYHKPPNLTNNGFVKHESTICANYLIEKKIPSSDILKEWFSYDTIANGYFAFNNFILPFDFNNIIIISSDFHINRVKVIFNYLKIIFKKRDLVIKYFDTNSYVSNEVYKIREERENNSIINFQKNIIGKINNLYDFSIWFFTEHNSYKSKLEIKYSKDNNLKNTY